MKKKREEKKKSRLFPQRNPSPLEGKGRILNGEKKLKGRKGDLSEAIFEGGGRSEKKKKYSEMGKGG